MRQRLIDLEATTQAIKPFLEQYLQEQGIDTSKNFHCINPKHDDSNASMTCRQYPESAYCFGCQTVCDCFTAAHFLEGKPLKGPEFITENVQYLADKFGISIKHQDMSPEEAYEYRTYRAYDFASKLISDRNFGDYSIVDKEIERRGWDREKVAEWGIGTVNYDEYKDRMKKAGFEPGFLSGVDLDRSNLFNNNSLLFTIYDDEGRPVGFSAKLLKENAKSKYINTRGTGLECSIFKKSQRLYGFELARHITAPLYIFEGQADVITARHHGLINCCSTLGTALTEHHINLLKKHGIFKVVLMFDGDEAGSNAIEKALDERFAKEKEFRVSLCQLPDEVDPDELIREHGIDEFVRMKKWSAFEWRMMKFLDVPEEEDDEPTEDRKQEIAQKMSAIISSEPSPIKREDMAKQVARMTGYDYKTIISEVKRLCSEKEADHQAKKKAAVEALLTEVKRNPDEAEMAVAQCQIALNDINKTSSLEGTRKGFLNKLLEQKEHDENRSGDFAGFYLRPDGLGVLGKRLDDDWKKDTLIFIGGGEQSAKTTTCCQLAYEIASDERNNAICIYHSIDDAARFIMYKWVCRASDDLKIKLNYVSNPNYWANQPGMEWVTGLRERGYKEILRLANEEKLILKDASDGSSLAYSESLVKFYREAYPNKNVVLFIDNFHKLPDYPELKDTQRTKRLCNHLKNMTVTHGVTIVCTVEYRKMDHGEKPQNQSIAESRAMMYDASVIIHLFNELHYKDPDEAILLHYDDNMKALPRIWCKFGKNKVSGYEGREFLDLYPAAATLKSVDLDTAIQDQKDRVEFLEETKDKRTTY